MALHGDAELEGVEVIPHVFFSSEKHARSKRLSLSEKNRFASSPATPAGAQGNWTTNYRPAVG